MSKKKLMLFMLVLFLTISMIAASFSIRANPDDDRLVLYYSFKDISGNTVINGAPTGSKYNGLIVGDANVTDNGKIGKALDIFGQGLGGAFMGEENVSRLEIPADILKEFKNGATFSFLINPENTENSVIMTTGFWDDQNLGFINFWLSHSIADSIGPHFAYQSYSSIDMSERDHLKTSEELDLDEWQWLTFTMDDKRKGTIYINDKAIGSFDFAYDIADLAEGLDFYGNDIIAIGSSSIFPADDGGNFLLDEVYMFNYALSPSEVKALVETNKERESEAIESPGTTPEETPDETETKETPKPSETVKPTPSSSQTGQQSQMPEATTAGSETSEEPDNTVLFVILGVVAAVVIGVGGFFTYKKLKK